jgi:hypothetical protein
MRKLLVLTVSALAAAWVGPASAAQQTLAGQNAQLKNPKPDPGGDATKRLVKGFSKENSSPNTIVGTPQNALGARLKVKTATGEQCFNLPSSGWLPIGTIGYKYKDSKWVNSAITTAQIKKANNGQFQLKFNGKAKAKPITIIPPTATLAYNFAIGNGDEYCGAFGSPTKNDSKLAKFGTSADPGTCSATSCYFCGDGVVTGTEACDTGGTDTAGCDAGDCTLPACGDLYVNAAAGEACDSGGDTAGCDSDCTLPSCGDGHLNTAAGETCDTSGVDTALCDGGDCTAPACGDLYTNTAAGEFCDTGTDTATCDAGDCSAVACGDGHVNSAAGEVCDPSGSAFGSGPPLDNGLCDGCLSPSGAFLSVF